MNDYAKDTYHQMIKQYETTLDAHLLAKFTVCLLDVQRYTRYYEYRETAVQDTYTDTKQGKSEGFDSCDSPSNVTKIGFKSSIFQPMWPWNLMDDLEK